MNARSALRRASRPDPSAPTSLDDVLGEPGLACLVFSFLPNARDRRNLARVCRVFHDASTRVASLPAAFDFTGVTTRLDAREFYKHLMRHDGVLDLPKERVHELLASLSHPLPRRTTDAETSSQGNKSRYFCANAAYVGDLELLKWLREHGYPWGGDLDGSATCYHAAREGHLHVLKWARANGAPWNERTCTGAAAGGHLEMLQWARANGCPWDEWTCYCAADGGHLEVLQWARANSAPWDENTCDGAAAGGHLEVLQWARANGAPWNENTCRDAAEGGHLEVLQWARAIGAPWDPMLCKARARNHMHEDVVRWISAEVGEGA